MKTLNDEIGYYLDRIYLSDREEKIMTPLLDREVIKEFNMSGEEDSKNTWLSWQEFGKHKNVMNWWLLDNGYAVGFNENPSFGWSFPIIKLKSEMFEKAKAHDKNYFQYYNNNTAETAP